MGDGYRFLSVPVGDAEEFVIDKEKSCREFATYFLMRVMKMFRYKRLPEEIPVDCMSKMLFCDGFGFFTKYTSSNSLDQEVDQYYFFNGRMGDIIDAYYRPTRIIIANPGANCYEDFELGKQKGGTYYGEKGVIIRNDTLYHGLMPLIKRYAYLLAENILTMHSADVFLRILALISASDDKTVISANEFIKQIEKGKMMAIADSKFFEGVKMQSPPSNNGSYLTQFIEYQQYFLGSFFNEIGLNANFNMKRESIAKSESSLNEDSMLPLCQNMLMCRREDFSVVNEMYGLNIEVDFDSAWLENALEIAAALNEMVKPSSGLGVGGKENFNDETTAEDQESEGSGTNDSGAGDGGNDKDSESVGRSGDSGETENSAESTGEEEKDGVDEAENSSEVESEISEESSGLVGMTEEKLDELISEATGIGDVEEEEEKKDESSLQEL